MSEESTFQELMQRVRARDDAAARELLTRYEKAIRRAIRVRLFNPRLRRLLDSVDICQSVFASFFTRAALGQYDLQTPEQLVKLLARMARNKVADLVRREQAERRDNRRIEEAGSAVGRIAAGGATPSQEVAGADLLSEFRKRLTDEERHLADQRALGREWAEIAAEAHQSPEALRKRLARALDRVAQELGLDTKGAD